MATAKPTLNEASNSVSANKASGNSAASKKAAEGEKSIAEAIEELKHASKTMYSAVGLIGDSSTHYAKQKVEEGKAYATDVGDKAGSRISEKPLLYVGLAFAAGWLGAKLTR